ncbi:MAG: DUF2953 domain-containing protein [Lachnotalea sp.]
MVILKVAGIVILAVLLVLLLLLILVLFVPIRYKASARKKTDVYAKASASWLFHIVHFSFYYDAKGASYKLRILGVSFDKWKASINRFKGIFNFKKNKNKKSKNIKTKQLSRTAKEKSNQLDVLEQNQSKENQSKENQPKENATKSKLEVDEFEKTQQDLGENKDDSQSFKIAQEENLKKNKKKHKFNIKKWVRVIRTKVKDFIQKIKNLIKRFISVCKNGKDKFDDIKSLVQDERNKKAFVVAKDQLIVALKHFKPKKYKLNLKFGTGDPAMTGQILGILGILMPVYKRNAHFIPDFENSILEGDIYMRGGIRLATVVLILWKLYKDKDVRRCYKMIMN